MGVKGRRVMFGERASLRGVVNEAKAHIRLQCHKEEVEYCTVIQF